MSCFLLFVPSAVLDHNFSFCINTIMLLFVNCVCVCERVNLKTVQPKESVTLVGYIYKPVTVTLIYICLK